jgi:hypothetical protein
MGGFHYFMIGVGALAALVGILIAIQRIRTITRGTSTEGVVVDSKIGSAEGRRKSTTIPIYSAIVEFKHEGKTYRCESSYGKKERIPNGTKLRVRYLPSDPKNTAEVDSFMAMWGFSGAALLFAALMIGLAVYDAGRVVK